MSIAEIHWTEKKTRFHIEIDVLANKIHLSKKKKKKKKKKNDTFL